MPARSRRYDSSRRREQAARSRREVLAKARALFLAQGFRATTMASIAAAAGVSVETLYASWGSKTGIVEALVREALRGDADAPPLERGEAVAAIQAEPSARRALGLYGELLARVQPQLAPVLRLLGEGAQSDAALAAILERNRRDRLEAMGRFAAHLAERGALGEGVSRERARDVLWTLNSPELYELLVEQRGWSAAEYGSWVAETLASALLDGAAP
ncbi:MAG TPA: helix-turn-helix domain-containing protein [Solirubrobacteraceae bacterium]|nr:helix-turn-helix domain-containing protein [Solirubrobacteraceae bacterium]